MDKYWSNTETGKWHFVSKASDNLKTTRKTEKIKVKIKFYGEVTKKAMLLLLS